MDTGTLFEVINPRSFSSLWYWIVVAVAWSSASHWVLGVPFDAILRARRHGGQAMADLEALARINASRLTYIGRVSGPWLMGLGAFLLTGLLLLALWYRVEFAQAVAFLLAPMTLVGALSMRLAERLEAEAPDGEALVRALVRHRFWTQGIGMVSIFFTAMFGMYRILSVPQGF